jgi:hypothetical protein
MKGPLAVVLLSGMVTAVQADPRGAYRWVDPTMQGKTWTPPQPATVSHVIYLNNCKPNGCTLHAGYNNATTNTSSIPNGTSMVSPYTGSAAQWQQLVQCVKDTYAPFNVTIVDQRPPSGDYHMAIVAGSATEVGESSDVLGVSPFTCDYIPNSISFTFANEEPSGLLDLCWTVAQETAHSWGLDHKFDNRDPMTYLSSGPAMKTFQNQVGACGEYNSRQCNCDYSAIIGTTQENSYALIMNVFGPSAPDTTPPTVTITSPAGGASVMPGFGVTATVSDDISVASAELKIDGMSIQTLSATPFSWNAPQTLTQGSHHVEVVGTDSSGNTATASVDVVYGSVCMHDPDCHDPMMICDHGHCVAGPSTPGGLGSPCTDNTTCASNECADDGQGHKYCVEACDPGMKTCPGGFGCVTTSPGTGVCWPGADNGGGGGCASTSGGGVLVVGIGLGAALITRRRRPKVLR